MHATDFLDFDLPKRAFVKTRCGDLSGPAKFTLLLAYLAKGAEGVEIEVREIVKDWNSMTSLLGGEFNAAYCVRAKDSGWVDSHSKGKYILCPGWQRCVK